MHLHKEFEVHQLNEEGVKKARQLALAFDGLLTGVEELCGVTSQGATPVGRELSIVRTKLEEACFFAKKAIALIPENQK